MAFNRKTFQTRTGTAIVFAAVMLTGLLWNYQSFFVLVTIIHIGCWWEYLKLAEKINNTGINNAVKYFLIFAGCLLMVVAASPDMKIHSWVTQVGLDLKSKRFLWAGLFALLALFLFLVKSIPGKARWMCLAGFIYISLTWGLMLCLRARGEFDQDKEFWNKALPLGLVLSIWVNDTMAYIVGSFFGKTPFSKISPKKTWEGTIGGIILAVLIIVLVFFFWWKIFTLRDWILISLIAAIAGTLGDLLESKLKRMAAVKDSGSLMPGHGGFLDRFDSLLLAIPAVCLYVWWFMQ